MARMVKDCKRADLQSENSKGSLFVNFEGGLFDSGKCNVIHNGLDTVRQMYSGLIESVLYNEIERVYNDGFGLTVKVGDFEFLVSSGGRSGYRYCLKNPNIGLVIMVGSQYIEPKYNGHHLKIQCSPVFLLSRGLHEIQLEIDTFADFFLSQVLKTGVAVHLCADVQGWIPPNDLDCRLTTRARRIYKYSGTQGVEYDYSGVSVVYGKGETFTFGKANSMQFTVYDKTKAVNDKGEQALWLPIWSQSSSYVEGDHVTRFEARFHHTVVQQFANGSGFEANSLIDLEKHLTGLWKYSLNNFRLDDSETYINPFWQWLRDDTIFYHNALLDIDYKRLYKAPNDDGEPSERSIAICFGQLCSIYGRNGYSVNKAAGHLANSGIWPNICNMYSKRGKLIDDIYVDLANKIERFQLSKVA